MVKDLKYMDQLPLCSVTLGTYASFVLFSCNISLGLVDSETEFLVPHSPLGHPNKAEIYFPICQIYGWIGVLRTVFMLPTY